MTPRHLAGFLYVLPALTAAAQAVAAEPEDGKVTLSTSGAWSEPVRGDATGGAAEVPHGKKPGEWLVAPIPFKNALLGGGVVLTVARLYGAKAGGGADSRESMFGAAGMIAEGGSWAAAAFDRRYLGDQRWRTTVGAGTGELHYDLSVAAGGTASQLPVTQKMTGGSAALDHSFRTYGWFGGGVQYARSPVSVAQLPAGIPDVFPELTYELVSVNLRGEWDTRDDQFAPASGMHAQAQVDGSKSSSAFKDDEFMRYKLSYNFYRVINPRNVLALRVYYEAVSGDAPFFALPWFGSKADLRGYSPGRYVGQSMSAAQAEWRWQVAKRFGLVAFAGVGGVYGKVPGFEQDDFLPAGGAGVRWRVTRQNRINLSVDYAVGRDDHALLISVGEAF